MNSIKKYVFTGVTKNIGEIVLHQIKRISDGVIGGWIEKEANLSHKDNAFVYENTIVYGDAIVFAKHHYLNLINLTYNITVTPQNAVIGCQIKTHNEWLKITKREAIKLGLPGDKYNTFKTLLKVLFAEVKQ